MKKSKSDYLIQSVSRALDILEIFNLQEKELGVTELSKRLKLHKNNVFRLLATLETRGYVEQEMNSGNYRLGAKTFEVGNLFLHHSGLKRQAKPSLLEIVRQCNETAYLTILDDGDVIYIDMVETNHPVRVVPKIGYRLPSHCTAMGKVHLAFMSQDEIEYVIKKRELRTFTPNTIVDSKKLFEHLSEIAQKGYAIDDEEYEVGVKCIAAPVRDFTNKVVGGIGISAPSIRMDSQRIENELLPIVKAASLQVSKKLGFDIKNI